MAMSESGSCREAAAQGREGEELFAWCELAGCDCAVASHSMVTVRGAPASPRPGAATPCWRTYNLTQCSWKQSVLATEGRHPTKRI